MGRRRSRSRSLVPHGTVQRETPANSGLPFAGFHSGYSPHEWKLGAWQRNLNCAMEDLTSFSAVYASVTIIAGDIGKLGIKTWRSLPEGGREEARNHYAWNLFRRPNSFQTGVEFMTFWLCSLLLTGNTYVLLGRDARGVVNEMRILDPRKVRVYVTDDGEPAYRVADDPLAPMDVGEMLPARDIMHDRMNTLWHPLVGVSPLMAAASSALAGTRILDQAENFFGNMSRPSGMLVTPARLSDTDHKLMSERWNTNYGGSDRAGKTAILGLGLEFKPLTMSAIDAQLIEQLKFSVEDVARCYRVPGFLLGDLTKVSYRNAEQLTRIYYQGCLQVHLERIEARIDVSLDLGNDISSEFDLDALFRMESDARFTAYQSALQAGWISINEVRAKEYLAPVKGGEVPRIQVQYQPIDAPPPSVADPSSLVPETKAPEPDDPNIEDPNIEADDGIDEADLERMIRKEMASYAEAA